MPGVHHRYQQRQTDSREALLNEVEERHSLDREERNFIERGINVSVPEHPDNDSAVRVGIATGLEMTAQTRGQQFQTRKDAIEIAITNAVKPHVVWHGDVTH